MTSSLSPAGYAPVVTKTSFRQSTKELSSSILATMVLLKSTITFLSKILIYGFMSDGTKSKRCLSSKTTSLPTPGMLNLFVKTGFPFPPVPTRFHTPVPTRSHPVSRNFPPFPPASPRPPSRSPPFPVSLRFPPSLIEVELQ